EIYDVMVAHRLEDLRPIELTRLFWSRPLSSFPGGDRLYSNGNYIVLGAMLEEVTGSPYSVLMEELVFEPLGMARTAMPAAGDIVLDRAAGYTRGSAGDLRNAPYFSPVLSSAAGALVSTVDDLDRFERALGHDWGWQPATVAGHPALQHGGSSIGWTAAVLRVPSQALFVAILTNRGFDREPIDLSHQLAELVLDDPAAARQEP
ncbi:MAG: serine hydrolase domain-containing protein, partial [Thermoanaerobaculia bacterium]|nr:serine hydrolase domain-containing protein [Thermoanaerobaculia bacterium]